jgi:hypothetical protein
MPIIDPASGDRGLDPDVDSGYSERWRDRIVEDDTPL